MVIASEPRKKGALIITWTREWSTTLTTFDRDVIVQGAMNHVEQNVGQVVGVGDLAGAANVSERTLRNAFTEYFGASPTKYLQLRQLHQVRCALVAADPEQTTVSSMLIEHGVWSFGRFAANYRKLFGELPVETLRTTSLELVSH